MSGIEYNINIKGFVEKAIEERFRSIVFDVWNRLSAYSPAVPTRELRGVGRTKGNWQTSINSYSNLPLERVSLYPDGDADQGESQAEVDRVLDSLKLKDTVFIVNNVPYIERVERGWPRKVSGGITPGYWPVERMKQDIALKYGNG
jgi:hypothetical protein